jgi:periplasmic copper chaperone A
MRWRRTRLAALVVSAVLVGLTGACGGADAPPPTGSLVVRGASVDRPVNDRRAVVRMVIDNRAGADDRLVGASSPMAEAATVHESMVDPAGRSTMEDRPGLDIPAGTQVFFSPGSYHVMLERLRVPLALGDEVVIVLEFERAGAVEVVATVEELPVN